ncbi:MAG: ABC transporter ATP-binding protein/permease [Coriobacteriales bacterium]|jgi:ATP-binding cassette subfamily B protein|nr:ABC transporter ATP-binding protein/permease [Coriobacteriales bacterium]
MSKSSSKTPVSLRTLQRFWQATKKRRASFVLALAATLGYVLLLTFANPYIVGLVVDKIAQAGSAPLGVADFSAEIVAFILVNLAGQACSRLQDYMVWRLEIQANYDLATYCFDSLSHQSLAFHSGRFGGSLVSQTQKYINAYTELLEALVYNLSSVAFGAIALIVILAPLLPWYVLILALLLALYTLIAYRMYKRILPLNSEAAAAQNVLSGELSDSITNILSVKTNGREAYERSLFDQYNADVLACDRKRMRASIGRGAVTSLILVAIMAVAAIFIGGAHGWFGVSAGTLVMVFTYTFTLSQQFNYVPITFERVNRGFGDAYDMTKILDEPRLVDDRPGAAPLEVCRGDIDFRAIGFTYPESDGQAAGPVFKDFNLEIEAGQRIGLVGRSGSGKTTLTTLLLRLQDLQEGQILIDGQNIAQVSQVSLRRQIAYVPQEPLLFHRSIYDNIAYGNPGASPEEVFEAARLAYADAFIKELPHGFDTLTGERGIKLSGGQRQRVAIARAILTAAPILVLDEATSALDSESEQLIQEALHNLMAGRTAIVVAHRLSTVAALDRIIVIAQGRIVEDGTHQELLQAGGVYADLWNRQSGAFLADD